MVRISGWLAEGEAVTTDEEVFDLPVAIYGPGYVGMTRDHYDRIRLCIDFGEPVTKKACGCAVSLDGSTTYLCEEHSGG